MPNSSLAALSSTLLLLLLCFILLLYPTMLILHCVVNGCPLIMDIGLKLIDSGLPSMVSPLQYQDWNIRIPKRCVNPSIRKEWRTLTADEKADWISAVKCLAHSHGHDMVSQVAEDSFPITYDGIYNPNASLFDDFSYAHTALNRKIHQTGFFFPWHRFFIWSFEQALITHCGFQSSLPYWDWTQEANNFSSGSIFRDIDPTTGLGGLENPTQNGTVIDGGFAHLPLIYPALHTLRREYMPYPYKNLSRKLFPRPEFRASDAFTKTEVEKIIRGFKGDFKGFQTYFEGMQGAHMAIHLIMGGDLGGHCPSHEENCPSDMKWSPNEPMFWLHHAMVDKIWSDWQQADPSNNGAFEGGSTRDLTTWPQFPTGAPPALMVDTKLPTHGILQGNFTIENMFNTTGNMPLCYIYQ